MRRAVNFTTPIRISWSYRTGWERTPDVSVRDRLPGFSLLSSGSVARVEQMMARGKSRAGVASERAAHEADLMTRKELGCLWRVPRGRSPSRARPARVPLAARLLDLRLDQPEVATDPDVAYGGVPRAHARHVDFCSADPRLLPATFVPLTMPERAIAETRFALDAGIKGVTISPLPPATHSITHPSLHPFYAQLEERGVPLLFHVEGHAPRKASSGFIEERLGGQTDFHGGGENFTGLLYMAVSQWIEIALSASIFDQVLEKFPKLKRRSDRARRRVGACVARADGDRQGYVRPHREPHRWLAAPADRVRQAARSA